MDFSLWKHFSCPGTIPGATRIAQVTFKFVMPYFYTFRWLYPFLLVICRKYSSTTSKYDLMWKLRFLEISFWMMFKHMFKAQICVLCMHCFLFCCQKFTRQWSPHCPIVSLSTSMFCFIFQNTGVPDETPLSSSGLLLHHKYACKKPCHCLGTKPAEVTYIWLWTLEDTFSWISKSLASLFVKKKKKQS